MAGGDLELRVAWRRHVAGDSSHDDVLESLVARHRGGGRHYHDARHVQWVVRHVLELAERVEVDDLDAVVAAAFFHDAVYEFDRDDNEARSADLAAATLGELGWDRARCDRVAAMIVATEHRGDDASHDVDTAVLVAADLAVLAAEPAAYSDAVRRIRREYSHLDDVAWREGRRAVIEGFLARPALFPPELGLETWERRARANLAAEAAALR